jgi:hypothetical protein
VYAAPRGTSPIGELGARWLGRHIDPLPAPPPAVTPLDPDALFELTSEPRVYGFHATLKPPFRLTEGVDAADLDAAVAAVAGGCAPVEVRRLRVDVTRGFASLVPEGEVEGLAELERACVVDLDGFRRPPEELDVARRRRARLSERQDELLLAYGYPWVLDEFQFHITLTRRLDPSEVEPVVAAAGDWFPEDVLSTLVIDELSVVEQAAPGEPFVVVTRHPLGGRRAALQG